MNHVFVSCVASKRDHASEAGKIYTSPWFKKASAYAAQIAEAVQGKWWILSAKHGLLDPRTIIEPYNETLTRMTINKRRCWADRVFEFVRLSGEFERGDSVVMLAGQRYREFLVGKLIQAGIEVSIPLEGLGIGQQLHWLSRAHPHSPTTERVESTSP